MDSPLGKAGCTLLVVNGKVSTVKQNWGVTESVINGLSSSRLFLPFSTDESNLGKEQLHSMGRVDLDNTIATDIADIKRTA